MNKKDALIWAAVDLMREIGFDKTSVSQIVKKANVAQGTFYLYFESKAQLVLGIAQSIMDDFMASLTSFKSTDDMSLTDFVSDLVDLTYDHTQKHQALIGFVYSGTAYYNSTSHWDKLYIPYFEWLSNRLAAYQNASQCKKEYPPDVLANLVVGLIEHSAEQDTVFKHEYTLNKDSKQVLKHLLTQALIM